MQTIYIDISNKGVVPAIYAKQGEVGRKFTAVLTDAGVPYVLDESALLSAWYEGTSGTGNYTTVGENSAFTVDGNKVTIELITQMLTNGGGGVLSVSINKTDGSEIATWNIPYLVEKKPGVDSPEAESFYTAFSEIAGQVADSANRAEAAAEILENITPELIGAATPEDVRKAAPYNLLDNSDFRNPVNQRGQTEYTDGYTIDRWNLWSSADDGKVTINNGYISIYGGSVGCTLSQKFESGILDRNKTYTMVYKKLNGEVAIFPAVITHDVSPGIDLLTLVNVGNITEDVVWAALYEGEYTTETLPEYQPKGYGAELVECMRYYQTIPSGFESMLSKISSFSLWFLLPVQMRSVPTVNIQPGQIINGNVFGLGRADFIFEYPNATTKCWACSGTIAQDDKTTYAERHVIFELLTIALNADL